MRDHVIESGIRSKFIADLILCLHLLFIVSFLGSVVVSFYFHKYAPFHLGLLLGLLTMHVTTGGCPLTTLEKKYRLRHNPLLQFNDSFYAHYFFGKLLAKRVTKNQVRVFLFLTKVLPGLLPLFVLFG